MTAACMDQSILKTGVDGLAHPPEFNELVARGWR
jgi:hypothetical protein